MTRSSRFALIISNVLALAACGGNERPPLNSFDASEKKDGGQTSGDSGTVPTDSGTGPADAGDCSQNPNSCGEGQLIGPPSACACLSGCEAGYQWTGTGCVRVDGGTLPDAAADDATTADDTGVADDASTTDDAAQPGDASLDDGALPADGAAPGDAGVPVDGAAPGDAALPDAPGPVDAAPLSDGGFNLDVGPRPDGGGVGLFEGDVCDPQLTQCTAQPGMTCQVVDQTNNVGLCMKTCNQAANTGGGTRNPACNGIGPNCVDIFNLGAANSRCLNSIPPFGELNQTVLDICDPTIANLFVVDFFNNGGVCYPLCTVTPSPTNPVSVTCSGTFNTCITDPAEQFTDADNNVFGTCGTRVARGQNCASGRGRFCNTATDICALGVCRREYGTTCTATTTCGAGEACVVAQTGGDPIAFCNQACDPLAPQNTCGNGRACSISVFSGQGGGSCRALTGNTQAGGDCSDPLDFATHATDCAAGTLCVPNNSTDGYQSASCLSYCDPAASTCPATETCTALAAPLTAYGLCI